jgi:hypothetical protein
VAQWTALDARAASAVEAPQRAVAAVEAPQHPAPMCARFAEAPLVVGFGDRIVLRVVAHEPLGRVDSTSIRAGG